jgi:hypothetical protein
MPPRHFRLDELRAHLTSRFLAHTITPIELSLHSVYHSLSRQTLLSRTHRHAKRLFVMPKRPSRTRQTTAAAAAAGQGRLSCTEASSAEEPPMSPLCSITRLPAELMLYIVEQLDPKDYLALSATCRAPRDDLKKADYLKRIVACPSSCVARSWERRSTDPLFEQVILQANFAQHARRSLHQCALLPWMAKLRGSRVSNDGRYIALLFKGSGGLWLWDLCARDTFQLDVDTSGSGGFELDLQLEQDLLLLHDSDGAATLWHLRDHSARRLYSVPELEYRRHMALANHGAHLIVKKRGSDVVSLLLVDELKKYKSCLRSRPCHQECSCSATDTVATWSGVREFACSKRSPQLLLLGRAKLLSLPPDAPSSSATQSTDESASALDYCQMPRTPQPLDGHTVQHWSNRALIATKSLCLFPTPVEELLLSDDGSRAVALVHQIAQPGLTWPPADEVACTWELNNGAWRLTSFSKPCSDLQGDLYRSLALASESGYFAYLMRHPVLRLALVHNTCEPDSSPLVTILPRKWGSGFFPLFASLLFAELRAIKPARSFREFGPLFRPEHPSRHQFGLLHKSGVRLFDRPALRALESGSQATPSPAVSPSLRSVFHDLPKCLVSNLSPDGQWVCALSKRHPVGGVIVPSGADESLQAELRKLLEVPSDTPNER